MKAFQPAVRPALFSDATTIGRIRHTCIRYVSGEGSRSSHARRSRSLHSALRRSANQAHCHGTCGRCDCRPTPESTQSEPDDIVALGPR
jgi:hypothetical protein